MVNDTKSIHSDSKTFAGPISGSNIINIKMSLGNISDIIIWIPAELKTSVSGLLTVAD